MSVAQKLFMVLVGGHTPTSNLEVHDMRFAAGGRIEDTYPALRAQWWGDPDTLHVDVWGEVSSIDGYAVELKPEPFKGKEKLFFVNLGGYQPGRFDELHENVLIVDTSLEKAKARARAGIGHWTQPHKDTLFEVEKILRLNDIDGLHVHLTQTDNPLPFSFHCRYTPISEKALARKAAR